MESEGYTDVVKIVSGVATTGAGTICWFLFQSARKEAAAAISAVVDIKESCKAGIANHVRWNPASVYAQGARTLRQSVSRDGFRRERLARDKDGLVRELEGGVPAVSLARCIGGGRGDCAFHFSI